MKGLMRTFMIAVLLSGLGSCAAGSRIVTGPVMAGEPSAGTFRVILFGCGYLDDPETVAFLDREGDSVVLAPHAPDFRYRVMVGVPAADALAAARRFVSCGSSFTHAQVTGIRDDSGAVLGYEVRPLYLPLTYGVDDILRVEYRRRGDQVIIDIRPIPSVEHAISGGGRRHD